MMLPTRRPIDLLAACGLAAILLPAAVSAQLATPAAMSAAMPAETPPERCLILETYPLPAGDAPHDVAPAADGQHVWYTAQRGGALGLLDPATGAVEHIPLGPGSSPHGVIVGPDGAAWVTDDGLNAIVRVDPATRAVEIWPLAGANANLNTAVFDPAGVLWFTGQNGIVGRLDPASQPPGTELTPLPAPRGQGPYGITVTPGGEVYFASLAGSYLGRVVQAADGSFTLAAIDPPTPDQGTRRVWSDESGILWSSQWNAGQVGSYDPAADRWEEWPLPGDGPQAYAVYGDERDDIWLSDFAANALLRFDPTTEMFVTLPLPDAGARVRQLHGRAGEVWGAESGVDKLVVVHSSCG